MTLADGMPIPDRSANGKSNALSRDELAFFVHELRGGLTVIVGYSELLGHEDLTAVERHSALEGIERAVSRIDSLCGDALAGRPPHRAPDVLDERVLVAALAEQIAAEQQLASHRRVSVTVAENTEAIAVKGSANALARVLGNLIDNALKYSPADTSVDVEVFLGDGADGGQTILIEIADRGPGIPECDRGRVFSPFERLERDAEQPGSGLGLAVVREVVNAHGGTVGVSERVGGGCLIRLELPIAE